MSSSIRRTSFLFGMALVFSGVLLACGAGMAYEPEYTGSYDEAPALAPLSTMTAVSIPKMAPTPLPAISEVRMLTLEWPPRIKVGAGDRIRLSLEIDDSGGIVPTAEVEGRQVSGKVVEIPDVYETHQVTAQARLDMAGMPLEPTGMQSEALLPGQPVTFYWSLRPTESGLYQGTIWVYLLFVLKDGDEEARKTISAQLVEVEAVTFMGLTTGPAGVLGAAGTVLGTILGIPFMDDVLKWFWKRIKK
ncbi:MAG: hypothetical protein JXA13_14815 [Anaerolineales bacterium]|nr:hypothetical protein [Anaerolineales bacterium]